ncbi:sepiapterin reductase [Halteromyces radiatus]|uniref:sepiapterin reductase n=1 Tax=Halteromyces radiatus TaxID=101107 RepID=UPI002220BE03|nr:sepiapterin reductase [Halteromyces radiatus]KAI8097515.1 sepiapterin reductase [Halteromyces radiatus]
MVYSLYVITGANRGFGRSIALTLANKCQNDIAFILIGRELASLQVVSAELGQYQHVRSVELAAEPHGLDNAATTTQLLLEGVEPLVSALLPEIGSITLINNAGSTGDLSQTVAEYQPETIQSYIDMNVTSYITLVSGFLKLYQQKWANESRSLQLVNISSLLAIQPFSHWGLYATGKAARDMLLAVIAKEYQSSSLIRTLSYAPGPLDNEMQCRVRETLGDPEQSALYNDMAKKGNLVPMEDSAGKLVSLLQNNSYSSGAHIDYFDI